MRDRKPVDIRVSQISGTGFGRALIVYHAGQQDQRWFVSPEKCCVCHQPCAKGKAGTLGGRTFCASHYQQALKAGRFQWQRTGIIELAIVTIALLFVGWVVGQNIGSELSIILGLSVALFVPLVFLFYIYNQDRLEPEPLPMVLGVFGLGGLLGYAVAQPLSQWAMGLENWSHLSRIGPYLAAIGITGVLQEFCKYAAVRYTVYFTDEFDEPVDAIIYTTAAGLGLATAINIQFLIEHDGLLTWAGCVFLASTTLLHVGSSAVLGYGLGKHRFAEKQNPLHLPLFFLVAICVSGVGSQWVLSAGVDGIGFQGTRALLVAAVLAALTLLVTQLATTRLMRQSLQRETRQSREVPGLLDPWIWLPALLLFGTVTAYPWLNQEPPKDITSLNGQLTARVPADWLVDETDRSLTARSFDNLGAGLSVKRLREADGTPVPPFLIDVEQTRMEDDTAAGGFGYRLLSEEGPVSFAPHTVYWAEYAIARNPPGCTNSSGVLPMVYRGANALVTTAEGGAWHIELFAPAEDFDLQQGVLADILQSLRVEP